MSKSGYATYIESSNELEVIRPGENSTRKIRCIISRKILTTI